ncbi:unnamed protein product, partial [Trichobilharzia regenti]
MLHSVGLSDPAAAATATVVYPHFTPFPPANPSSCLTNSLSPNENSSQFTNSNGMYPSTTATAAAAAAAVAALTAAAAASAGL